MRCALLPGVQTFALPILKARVIDLRWLGPVDEDALLAAVGGAQRILIVDECRITGSQSEALMALFTERAPDKTLARIAADDSFIPRSEEHTSELQSLMRISYAVFCLTQKNNQITKSTASDTLSKPSTKLE